MRSSSGQDDPSKTTKKTPEKRGRNFLLCQDSIAVAITAVHSRNITETNTAAVATVVTVNSNM